MSFKHRRPGTHASDPELLAVKRSRLRFTFGLAGLVAIFLAALLWPLICITVPAGHVAVNWYRFLGGTDTGHVYGEGSHFIICTARAATSFFRGTRS
jgi:hypothetical protein